MINLISGKIQFNIKKQNNSVLHGIICDPGTIPSLLASAGSLTSIRTTSFFISLSDNSSKSISEIKINVQNNFNNIIHTSLNL